MSKSAPKTISIEEAVARMVNVDCDPSFPLLEMTEAFMDEAEVEYDNALIDQFPTDQIVILRTRMEICRARHYLAQDLMAHLQYEVKNIDTSELNVIEAGPNPVFSLDSLFYWAMNNYGIKINIPKPPIADKQKKLIQWKDITIKILKNDRISYQAKNGKPMLSTFKDIGLYDGRSNTPNHQCGILIALSQKMKYPNDTCAKKKYRTAMSKLRNILKQFTGIDEEPFLDYDKKLGWRPRFKLIYDVNNADRRFEEQALHTNIDDPSGRAYKQTPENIEYKETDAIIDKLERKLPVTDDK